MEKSIMTDKEEFISLKMAFEPFSKFEPGSPIRLLPEGTWYRGMRKLEVTRDRLMAMAKNFADGLPRFRIPINLDHVKKGGKVGTISNIEYLPDGPKGAGLYATKYEFSSKGLEAIEENGYDAVSAEVVWTVGNAQMGEYQDPETGKKHDNVLVGMALTPTPFFGHGHVALFAAEATEDLSVLETPFGGVKSFEDYAKQVEESEERSRITNLHDVFRMIFNNIWDDFQMGVEDKIESINSLTTAFRQKVSRGDNFAEDNITQEETMSEDTIVATNTTDSTAANYVSIAESKPVGVQLTQEEFDALTSQAALADTHAQALQRLEEEREVKEKELAAADLRGIAEAYTALPIEVDEFVEKMGGLNKESAEWVKAQFAAFDAALEAAGVFKEVGSDEEAENLSFLDVVDKLLAEDFSGDQSKYSEALLKASKLRPELAKV